VQEDALLRYAHQRGGTIVKFYKVAETASKHEERKAFKDLLAYSKKNAEKLDGILFLKVDRAARNLFDYVELERLEADYRVPVIYVTLPPETSPCRMLVNSAWTHSGKGKVSQMTVGMDGSLKQREAAPASDGAAEKSIPVLTPRAGSLLWNGIREGFWVRVLWAA